VEQVRDRRETDAEFNQLISFQVGAEEYGLEILRVKEVIRVREITRLPMAPGFVKGSSTSGRDRSSLRFS
jgi:purine-binding chemotaxis protein CheW